MAADLLTAAAKSEGKETKLSQFFDDLKGVREDEAALASTNSSAQSCNDFESKTRRMFPSNSDTNGKDTFRNFKLLVRYAQKVAGGGTNSSNEQFSES